MHRIAERIFTCGRWPAIQSRQPPLQGSADKIYQFLSRLVHCEGSISSSLYVRLAISEVRISSVFPPFLATEGAPRIVIRLDAGDSGVSPFFLLQAGDSNCIPSALQWRAHRRFPWPPLGKVFSLSD